MISIVRSAYIYFTKHNNAAIKEEMIKERKNVSIGGLTRAVAAQVILFTLFNFYVLFTQSQINVQHLTFF